MPIVNEAKRMTLSQYLRRRRVRVRNKRNRSYYVTRTGKKVRITAKRRAAMRRNGRRLARMARRASVRRKIARTKRMRRSIYRQLESRNPRRAFIDGAIQKVIEGRKAEDVAACIAEAAKSKAIDSKIVFYAEDAATILRENRQLSTTLIDVFPIDEQSLGIVFDGTKVANESIMLRTVKTFGDAALLARPGDMLDENNRSLVFLFAVRVDEKAMESAINLERSLMVSSGQRVVRPS